MADRHQAKLDMLVLNCVRTGMQDAGGSADVGRVIGLYRTYYDTSEIPARNAYDRQLAADRQLTVSIVGALRRLEQTGKVEQAVPGFWKAT